MFTSRIQVIESNQKLAVACSNYKTQEIEKLITNWSETHLSSRDLCDNIIHGLKKQFSHPIKPEPDYRILIPEMLAIFWFTLFGASSLWGAYELNSKANQQLGYARDDRDNRDNAKLLNQTSLAEDYQEKADRHFDIANGSRASSIPLWFLGGVSGLIVIAAVIVSCVFISKKHRYHSEVNFFREQKSDELLNLLNTLVNHQVVLSRKLLDVAEILLTDAQCQELTATIRNSKQDNNSVQASLVNNHSITIYSEDCHSQRTQGTEYLEISSSDHSGSWAKTNTGSDSNLEIDLESASTSTMSTISNSSR